MDKLLLDIQLLYNLSDPLLRCLFVACGCNMLSEILILLQNKLKGTFVMLTENGKYYVVMLLCITLGSAFDSIMFSVGLEFRNTIVLFYIADRAKGLFDNAHKLNIPFPTELQQISTTLKRWLK